MLIIRWIELYFKVFKIKKKNLVYIILMLMDWNIMKVQPYNIKTTKVKTFIIQELEQKLSTSKTKSKNFEHPRIRTITFNIKQ